MSKTLPSVTKSGSSLYLALSAYILKTRMRDTATMAPSVPPSKPHILAVGVAVVDFVARVDHFPKPDEKMRSTELLVEGGGNSANTACAIGRLQDFCECSIVTAVGDDSNSKAIVDGLEEMNVKTDHIERFSGSSPFTYIFCADVDGDSTRTCIHQPSAGKLSIGFVSRVPLQEYTAVHFDARYPAAAVVLATRCVEMGIPYSVDVERPREGLLELLKNASIILCNSNYCDTVLGEDDNTLTTAEKLKKVAGLQAPHAKLAIQTLGSKGCLLLRLNDEIGKDEIHLISADDGSNAPTIFKKGGLLSCAVFGGCKVVDTTGAGDAFQGGFLAALWSYIAQNPTSSLDSIPDTALGHSIRIAARVAARKIEQPGARKGLPVVAEDEFLQAEFKSLLKPE